MIMRTRILALRGLVYGLLLSWLVKIEFFVQAVMIYSLRPLHDDFFPIALQQVSVAETAYCIPVVIALAALLRFALWPLGVAMLAFFLASGALLLHQDTYNDATFVSSLWVSAVGLWFYRASAQSDAAFTFRLAFLTQLLFGLLFLGGFAGKLTSGYLDGSVLYDIYFIEHDHFTYTLLREHLGKAQLRQVATLYSWLVLVIEGGLASLPLWPSRTALKAVLPFLTFLVLLNNIRLVSVVGSLFALGVVALWLLPKEDSRTSDSTEGSNLIEPQN